VSRLILYPFIILFLMLLSRSRVFDNWDWPAPLILIFGINLAYAVGANIVLRRAAERARMLALERLSEDLFEPDHQSRIGEIERLMENIKSIRQGAFASWVNHPLVAALLIPLGGMGSWELVQRFLLNP